MNKRSLKRPGNIVPHPTKLPQFNLIPEFVEHIKWIKHEAGYIVGSWPVHYRREDHFGRESRPCQDSFLVEVWPPYFLLAPQFSEGHLTFKVLHLTSNTDEKWFMYETGSVILNQGDQLSQCAWDCLGFNTESPQSWANKTIGHSNLSLLLLISTWQEQCEKDCLNNT